MTSFEENIFMKLIEGIFLEGEFIIVEINGNRIKRKVKYSKSDGLYIVYKNAKYFEYECDYN